MKAWLVTREQTANRSPARFFRRLLEDCWLCMIACITAWSPWSSFDDHRSVFTLSREIRIVLWLTIIRGKTSQWASAHDTLGARDFSSAVSGFCQVFIVTRAKSFSRGFAARGFGLRPKLCRPSADKSRRTREKPLVPRVAHECQSLKFTIQHTSREKLKLNCRCDHHFLKIVCGNMFAYCIIWESLNAWSFRSFNSVA